MADQVPSAAVPSRPMITPAPHQPDKETAEKTDALAAEADKIRKEYDEKLSNLQMMYEKEQSSKQKLQEDLDKLEKEYSEKLDRVQEEYDHMTEAEQIVNEFEKQGEAAKAKAPDESEAAEDGDADGAETMAKVSGSGFSCCGLYVAKRDDISTYIRNCNDYPVDFI